MKTKSNHLAVLLAALVVLDGGCGVEVGNPHGKKGTTPKSSLVINLADAPADELKHVYFNVTGLSVLPASGDAVPLHLEASGKVDALELQNGKTLEIATSDTLPVGEYGAVVVELDEANPASVVDLNDQEQPVDFTEGKHGIFVAQAFSVTEGEPLELTLHVDLRRSLTRGDNGGRFAFGPRATVLPKKASATFTGSTAAKPEITLVCAYLTRRPDFEPGKRLPRGEPGGPMLPPPDGDSGPRPPRADHLARAEAPPSFGEGEGFLPEDDADCAHAFATTKAVNGEYTLSHLWPGQYQIRFVKQDGTDASQPMNAVRIGPGQTLNVDAQ